MVFLDFTFSFDLVPHNLLWTAFDFFKVPLALTRCVKQKLSDQHFCIGDEMIPTISLKPVMNLGQSLKWMEENIYRTLKVEALVYAVLASPILGGC